MSKLEYKTTKDIPISKRIIDQVVGQDEAIKIIKKAAYQRRNVLLIGEPGTGKSLLGQALSELLPDEKLKDIVAFPNIADDNVPIIKTFPKGKGKELVTRAKVNAMGSLRNQNIILLVFVLIATILPYYFYSKQIFPFDNAIIYAASMITSIVLIVAFMIFLNINKKSAKLGGSTSIPKLLLDNSNKKKAPFFDATGAHAGALLGDVLHDPLQCFSISNILYYFKNNNKNKPVLSSISIIDNLLKKHEDSIVKKGSYEACFLDKDEFYVGGLKDNKTKPVEVLSVNKHLNKHPNLYKITTESGKEIIVTPEHKIPISKSSGTKDTKAQDIKIGDQVFVDYTMDTSACQTYKPTK